MHERWPAFTYDVTIKTEHLLKHAGLVPHLKRTGVCSSQARSKASDDRILAIFDKLKGALIGFLPITKVLRKLLPVGWRRLNWLELGATGVARFLRARAEAYFLPQNQLGFTG
jgi:hypothetical protein